MLQNEFLTAPLSLALPGDRPDYDQVVNTVFDALRAGAIIEDQLQDGFQWTDLFGLRNIPEIVTGIVADIPTFIDQLANVDPEDVLDAIVQARQRLESYQKGGKVVAFIANALTLIAKGYDRGSELYEDVQNLLKGNDVTA